MSGETDKKSRAKHYLGKCNVGRGGETCRQCANLRRQAKSAASKESRRIAKKENSNGS